jgi:hypothetical protein
MADLANLLLAIDATQVTPAATKLDSLTAAGTRAEAATTNLNTSTTKLRDAYLAAGGSAAEADKIFGKVGASTTAAASATSILNKALAENAAISDGMITAAAVEAAKRQAVRAEVDLQTKSILAQATAAAEASEVQVAANESMAASLGALGSASVRNAAIQIEATEAVAAATVESSAVQVAANGAVTGSSIKVRESLVLLREAARGNWTRFAGSTTILAGAFGVLYSVMLPVIAAAVAIGAVFAVASGQIDQTAGDLTKGMNLSAEQLEKVKSKSVTIMDTIRATFQVVWKDISSGMGGFFSSLLSGWDVYVNIQETFFEDLIGSVIGTVRAVIEAWKSMPTWLGGEGKSFSLTDIWSSFKSGITDTKTAVDNFTHSVTLAAEAIAKTRITKEAGKSHTARLPIANDNQVSAANAELDVLNKQTASQVILNKAIADGSITVAEAARQDSILNSTKSLQKEIDKDNIEGAADLASGDAKRIVIGNRLIEAAKDLLPILVETKTAQGAAYDAKISNEIVKQTSAINDQTAAIQKQVKFVGMAADAIALEISQEKALQYLKDKGVSASSPDGKAYIDATTQQTAAQLALNDAQSNYNLLLAATQNAATGLGNAFGKIGTAIGNMAVSFQNYTELQKVFADRQATINKLSDDDANKSKEQTLLTNAQSDAELSYYADSIGGVKNMFGQKTAAYEALNAIEGTMQAIRLARKIEDIATNIPQTISNITAGAAKMFAELGPFGFAAVAAMMAVMAGLGFSGGGSSAGPVIDDGLNGGATAKANQAAQGAGSVLGDSAAKSASIANSLTQLEKNSNADLEYSNQMVVSLKAIQNSIGKVASSLAGQLTTGGSLSTTNLGLGTSGSSGILGLFASSTTKVLQDQGVQLAAQTIAQIAAQGIAGQTYQQVQTTTKNSGFFGIGGGTSQNSNTTSANLPTNISSQIGSVISGLSGTVLAAANKLGISGAQSVIDSFSVNIGKISLVGLSGSQITDALNAVFSKVGDDLTNAVIPQVKSLAQVGEGSLETLSRLVSEYSAVDDAMATIGSTFNSVGIDSLTARDNLVQLSGGISQFASQANFFASNFLSSAQALLPIQNAVTNEMASLGFAGVTTKAQFAALVQSIDVSTDSGAALYATLMNVAPAFSKVADAATALAKQQSTMQQTLLGDQGDAVGALALKRQDEIAALDASLVPLQMAIYAQEDLNAATAAAAKAATDAATALAAAQTNLTTAQTNLTTAQTAVTKAQETLTGVSTDLSAALNTTISKFQSFADSLKAFAATIGDSSNPINNLATTRATFNSTNALAQTGDATALGNLQQVATSYLAALQTGATTKVEYDNGLAAVRSAVVAAANVAQNVAIIASGQLTSINMAALQTAQANLATAQAAYNSAYAAIPGHATGLNNVPYDNYLMKAHQGEAVLTRAQADQWRSSKVANSNTDVVSELRGMRAEQKTINANIDANTKKVAYILTRVTQDGNSLLTTAA